MTIAAQMPAAFLPGRGTRHRLDFAGAGSVSSASPLTCRRSSEARARAASARASARETSSSASASEAGASVVAGSASESVTGPGLSLARRITLSLQSCWLDGLWGCATGSPPRGGCDLLRTGEFSYRLCKTISVRVIVAVVAALIGIGVLMPPTAAAGPTVCDYPDCTPGIAPHMVLGAPCDNTTYYAFGVTDYYTSFSSQPGRLMFCGSPRRYQPRWFRSPPMAGIKEENADCHQWINYVAQAPDGLFLVCIAQEGRSFWTRADT
jgi:hypothetical protein